MQEFILLEKTKKMIIDHATVAELLRYQLNWDTPTSPFHTRGMKK
jgi:hypothetical protein